MKIEEVLKENELKITPARKAILELLNDAVQPLDVQTIVAILKKKKISTDPATVFRTVNSFVEKNVLRQIQLMEGKIRYELVNKGEHHHFICKNCGEIQDISDCNIAELERKIEKMKNVEIRQHSLEFYGYCQSCLAKSKRV